MLGKRQLLGRKGEKQAASYLKKKHGFKIVEKNFTCKHGEIDLIAKDGDVLVFVEVKTRSQESFGSPASSVNFRKQLQISKAAHYYISQHHKDDIDARFDVVSILCVAEERPVIEHIPNAFEFCIS